MKHILCALGMHKASSSQYIFGIRVIGGHVYKIRYAMCTRCGKKMYMLKQNGGVGR